VTDATRSRLKTTAVVKVEPDTIIEVQPMKDPVVEVRVVPPDSDV